MQGQYKCFFNSISFHFSTHGAILVIKIFKRNRQFQKTFIIAARPQLNAMVLLCSSLGDMDFPLPNHLSVYYPKYPYRALKDGNPITISAQPIAGSQPPVVFRKCCTK